MEGRQRKQRDLAVDFSLDRLAHWSEYHDFVAYLLEQNLKLTFSEADLSAREHGFHELEEDLCGLAMTVLVVSGVVGRESIHNELPNLTSSHLPLFARTLQYPAYKRHQNSLPKYTVQQQRLPLPLLAQGVILRLGLFYQRCAEIAPHPKAEVLHRIDFTQPDQYLFPSRIRQLRRFLIGWLSKQYEAFHRHRSMPPSFPSIPVRSFSWKYFMAASRIRLVEAFPPWVVAGLRQRWKGVPSFLSDYGRVFHGVDPGPRCPSGMRTASKDRPDRSLELSSDVSGEVAAEVPSGLHEAYAGAAGALRSLHADMPSVQRIGMKQQIHHISQDLEALVREGQGDSPLIENGVLLLNWLEWMLGSKRLAPDTVKSYFNTMPTFIFYLFGATPIRSVTDADELMDIVTDCMSAYDKPQSQRSVKIGFQSFFRWLAKRDPSFPTLNWKSPEFRVVGDRPSRAVFSFHDVDRLLSRVSNWIQNGRLSDGEGANLRAFIILCFYAGLRRREATRLSLRDFDDRDRLLWVRRSKTINGIRLIPLALLIPPPYLDEIMALWRRNAFRDTGSLDEIPLLPGDDGNFVASSYFGKLVNSLMAAEFGTGSAHALRHSFATWFIIRADIACKGLPVPLPSSEFAHPIFSQEAIEQMRVLLFHNPQKAMRTGLFALPRPLPILQTLLGHSCTETTLSIYAHALDWVYQLTLLREPDLNHRLFGISPRLSVRQAASLLVQSERSLYRTVVGPSFSLESLVSLQRRRLSVDGFPLYSE